jgi:hypothetical protein
MSVQTGLRYETFTIMDDELYEQLDALQRLAMGTLHLHTAVRHTYHRTELEPLAKNDRVIKVAAFDGPRMVGLCALSNDLDALEFNADFLRSRYPEVSARNAIWYAALGVVDPDYWRHGIFNVLGEMLAEVLYSRRAEILMWDAVDIRFDMMHHWYQRLAGERFGEGVHQTVFDQHRWVAVELPPVADEVVVDLRGVPSADG